MRAIRITEWGGPEVLELVEDAPVPEADDAPRARPRHARGHQLRRHARAREHLPRALRAAADARAPRWRASSRRTAAASRPASGSSPSSARAATRSTSPRPRPRCSRSRTASRTGRRSRCSCRGSPRGTCSAPPRSSRPGESVVVHAAAGGVGSLAVQLARPLGAGRVIATASTEEKRALALELGADEAVDVTREDLGAALVEANLGEPVDVVLEMAGGRVFDASLGALAPFGRLVTYGMASREPNQVARGALMRPAARWSGFWLVHCLAAAGRDGRRARCRTCSSAVARGELRVDRGRAYPGCPRRAARTRTCRRGGPPASCCSTRRAEPRGRAVLSWPTEHDDLRRPPALRIRPRSAP